MTMPILIPLLTVTRHQPEGHMADLGNYIEKLSASYPNECEKVSKLIGETVLYHRENGSLCDSTGIAVYLPVQVGEYRGLDYYLNYLRMLITFLLLQVVQVVKAGILMEAPVEALQVDLLEMEEQQIKHQVINLVKDKTQLAPVLIMDTAAEAVASTEVMNQVQVVEA